MSDDDEMTRAKVVRPCRFRYEDTEGVRGEVVVVPRQIAERFSQLKPLPNLDLNMATIGGDGPELVERYLMSGEYADLKAAVAHIGDLKDFDSLDTDTLEGWLVDNFGV